MAETEKVMTIEVKDKPGSGQAGAPALHAVLRDSSGSLRGRVSIVAVKQPAFGNRGEEFRVEVNSGEGAVGTNVDLRVRL